jgi:predicted Zn-dependent peptidase
LASSIVGENETSRLYRRLVRQDRLALSAGLGLNTLIAGNSLGLGSMRALPGQDLEELASVVSDVLHRFAGDGPSDRELQMARAQAERDWLDEMGTAAGRADAISACTLLFDDAEALNQRLPLLRSITGEEVREAAETWLLPGLNAQVRVHPEGPAERAALAGEMPLEELEEQ